MNWNELVSGAEPPVVALTVTGKDPVGVPGSLVLEVPPQDEIHRVDNPRTAIRVSIRTLEHLRESGVSRIPNSPGNRTA